MPILRPKRSRRSPRRLFRWCACLAFVTLAVSQDAFARHSLFFLEYKFINSTGHHISPGAIFYVENPFLNLFIGAKTRFQETKLNTLTYLISTRWLPFRFFGLTTGLYHKDYYYIDVGEDVVWIGPAIRIPLSEISWVGIEGGINYRGFRLGGNYAVPFSFQGDGQEFNYFTVLELMLGYGTWSYRFALQNRDEFTMYRFQSLGIDNTVFIHTEETYLFFGAEVRTTGMFIGSATLNHVRAYMGLTF